VNYNLKGQPESRCGSACDRYTANFEAAEGRISMIHSNKNILAHTCIYVHI
jgi:hypothetical protein